MSAYIISIAINGIEFDFEKVDDAGLRHHRPKYAWHVKNMRKNCNCEDVRLVVKQAYETHVREFSKKRQDWIAYINTEFADAWEDDPCLGCGGVGGGWVRECPSDCGGRYWHERMNEIAEFGGRYTPKTIW